MVVRIQFMMCLSFFLEIQRFGDFSFNRVVLLGKFGMSL